MMNVCNCKYVMKCNTTYLSVHLCDPHIPRVLQLELLQVCRKSLNLTVNDTLTEHERLCNQNKSDHIMAIVLIFVFAPFALTIHLVCSRFDDKRDRVQMPFTSHHSLLFDDNDMIQNRRRMTI